MSKAIDIDEINWENARTFLQHLMPELVDILDNFSPTKKHKLYLASYNYGDEIINSEGFFQLPQKNDAPIKLFDNDVPKDIVEQLSYNSGSNPVGISLDKNLELYINSDNKIIPFASIAPGKLFGLWKILDENEVSHCPPVFSWGMTAGIRSLFMLPKISDTAGHRKLMRKYNLDIEKPKHLLEHFHLFKSLSSQCDSEQRWKTRVLFFGKSWFSDITKNTWQQWHYYLLKKAWGSTEFWRNQFIWDLTFSRVRARKNIKPSPYVAGIVKHIFEVAVGALPGYSPATSNSSAPIEFLQDTYTYDYQLKSNCPILMEASYVAPNNDVYLSLQHFLPVEDFLKTNSRLSTLDITCHANSLLQQYLQEIKSKTLNIDTTPLNSIPDNVNIEFFHSDGVGLAKIHDTSMIPIEDDNFIHNLKKFPETVFPKRCSFLQGCIKISVKDT